MLFDLQATSRKVVYVQQSYNESAQFQHFREALWQEVFFNIHWKTIEIQNMIHPAKVGLKYGQKKMRLERKEVYRVGRTMLGEGTHVSEYFLLQSNSPLHSSLSLQW